MPLTVRSRRDLAALLLVVSTTTSGCLNENLIKQPELTIVPGAPPGWNGTGGTSGIGTTVSDRHGGTTSAYMSSAFQAGFLTNYLLAQAIRADSYRGKRVRLSAWVKPRNIANASFSGIWMRVDGPGVTLEHDNMARRAVSGYGNWRQVSVVLDVPNNAIGITFGAQFQATNTLLVDDMLLEIVGTDVVSTNTLTAPIPDGRDSATTVAAYERSAASPVNLDFEGVTMASGEMISWILQPTVTMSLARRVRTRRGPTKG